MIYNELGKTGIRVSSLGLGTLTMGTLQKGFSAQQAKPVVKKCLDVGINFFDSAQIYGSYHVCREAIKMKKDVIVASKSFAETKAEAKRAVEECLSGIGRDYVDIWLLHGTDNQHTIRGHWEAIEYYLECKKKGIIRSVGFSSHTLQSVKDSLLFPDLDVIHPVVNYKGLGITDGTKEEMEEAVALASNAGKGIYAMKVFGGGRLVAEPKKALDYSINFKGVHSTVIGMQSVAEVEFNVAFFLGRESELSEETKRAIRNTNEKTLKVRTNCIACGKCMPICPTKALSLKNGRLEINKETCVLCGYCGNSCDINALLIQ